MEDEIGGAGCVWGRRYIHKDFWQANLKERYHLEDLGVDGRTLFKWALKKWDGIAWTVFFWLKVGTSVGFV
jgi:hypothetical protein